MARMTVNGVELAFEVAGPEGAPWIAFSNSLGGTIEMWDGVVERLAARYRCLRYDTRGHGRSGTSSRPISIADLAADLVALLDYVGATTAEIVGLSLGGMTAQALASSFPLRARSLTLIATAPHMPPPEPWRERAATVRTHGMTAVADAVIARWFTTSFYATSPKLVERVRERFLASDPEGYARCAEAIAAMDLRPRLDRISAPTLVMGGSDDQVVPPPVAEDLRTRIKGAELVVLPRASHLMSVERPDAVAEHIARHIGGGDREQTPSERGLAVRKSVLGDDYVERAIAEAGAFGAPWQDFITRVAWGEIWGDATLTKKTRSLVTLALTVALKPRSTPACRPATPPSAGCATRSVRIGRDRGVAAASANADDAARCSSLRACGRASDCSHRRAAVREWPALLAHAEMRVETG
jgi:3-oxoadipate enol-lactonase/4-carboxymuconolactone decarboxylase